MLKRILLALALLLGLTPLAQAGDSYDHRVDESKNAMGANRCSDSRDCDGKRTCSPFGWCQGVARPQAGAAPSAAPVVQTVEVTRVVTVLVTPAPGLERELPRPERQLPETRPGPGLEHRPGPLTGHWYGAFAGRKLSGTQTSLELDFVQEGKELSGRAQTVTGNTLVSTVLRGKTLPGQGLRFELLEQGGAPGRVFSGTVAKGGDRLSGTWKFGAQRGVWALQRGRANPTPQPTPTAMPASNADLEGYWDGQWQYNGNIYKPTIFSMALSRQGQGFVGVCDEPNTFPGTKAKTRHSFIQRGVVSSDGAIQWDKQMDGAEGIGHLIVYQGALSQDHQSASGTWQIPGKNAGTWFMQKAAGPSLISGGHLLGGASQPVPTPVPATQPLAQPTPGKQPTAAPAEPTALPTHGTYEEELQVVDGTPMPTRVANPNTPPAPAPTKVPTPAARPNPNAPPTPAPTAAPTPVPAQPQTGGEAFEPFLGNWRGNAHPGPKGMNEAPLDLDLSFNHMNGKLAGHGIVTVHDNKPHGRNVDLTELSFKDPQLKFSVHFSDPEEDDMNYNFVGTLQDNGKLIKGTWDHSGAAQGEFELHLLQGGK